MRANKQQKDKRFKTITINTLRKIREDFQPWDKKENKQENWNKNVGGSLEDKDKDKIKIKEISQKDEKW